MALATVTKELFARELQRLARQKPIAKITVAEICRASGATRQTFYYHFHDKYDLVAWIYSQDLARSAGPEGDMGSDSLERMLNAVHEKADFYRSALRDTSQNNLLNYIQEYGTDLILEFLKKRYALEPTHELYMAVRYHSYGMVGLTFDWLNGTCSTSARELADLLSKNIELILRAFVVTTAAAAPRSPDPGR